ncbi:MAG: shikimate kinase [Salibacteraceae bacterium]
MDISLDSHIQFQQPVKRVFLWGMMGVGKSSYAKRLAHLLSWKAIDLDVEIEGKYGKSIAELFEENGELAFREIERAVLNEVVLQEDVVIATGGGSPCFGDSSALMKESGLCVWLDAPMGLLVHRIQHAKVKRPLVDGLSKDQMTERLNELMDKRHQYYSKAHMIISVHNIAEKDALNLLVNLIEGK